ncbi:hypothetical protein [Gimesia aquarii]|uniref:YMGG-like Gly-zipper domain-containing protein n=1 Tax=Gimesia aquarii TaxID=2527964 RepID=A0A517WX17_9PLAN|nr:hypothetical protein [Gimesia aquarii]QDU09815.1 hypothetical protein V202x_32120 [Gimesia aquarii]
MLRRSVKLLTAAAILGISPALLSAQIPVESPGAQLESKANSNAQIKSKSNVTDAVTDRVKTRQGAKSKMKSDTKLDTNTKLDSNVDARIKSRGKTNTPGVTPPPPTNTNSVDGAIKRGQKNAGAKARVHGGADVDVPTRRKTNRPITNGNRPNLKGQGNFQIDAMVRQGTAHLDIDDETRARYRYHNGHWWYKTENDQWLIDNNGVWEPFDPVTYRNPKQSREQDYYQEQGDEYEDYQTDGSYYYDDTDYYYDNSYGNRRFYNRGNGYYGNWNNNRNWYGNRFNYNRGFNNRGHRGQWNHGRRNFGNRGSARRQGAAVGAQIGGAIGGNRGAAIGAGIGAQIAD